ncbi:FKBP-type peptidyl-prolyl cis-trans isomerase [Giardia lamblia P15]|uniref:peptidylprolyl isomerase n=1 Tax=Giardia intestinalis (strain P15) TaxID=658858 RepID=E1F9G0_GIAIA|nr:FKBP-type peptidyl-prolyl cis-trans isomerase [Giardia lamblia P15]
MWLFVSLLMAAMSSCFNNPKLLLKEKVLCISYETPAKKQCSLQVREMYKATLEFEAKDGQQVIYHNHNAVYGGIDVCFINTAHHFTFAKGQVQFTMENETIVVTDIEANELIYVSLAPGSGPAPLKGQTVMAHYTGMYLNGTVFDTSRKRSFPFMFHLGQNEVISGWDLTFASMQAKEKGIIVVPYQYGYGEQGIPPTIPPRSTLVFEVELVQIN